MLRVEHHDGVALLTLDDPARRNALSSAMVEEIVTAMDRLDADDETGALVVTGAPPAFCSGADVGALSELATGRTDPTGVRGVYDGFLRILDSPLPTVAAVNGHAVGAGLNLALACDVRLAAESARFDARFLRLGIHPGGGHLWLLERAVGPQAAAVMDLFGERLDGQQAARVGLAWRCVPDDVLLEEALELAGRAAEARREVATRVKATLRRAPWQPDFATAVRDELDAQVWSFRGASGHSAT